MAIDQPVNFGVFLGGYLTKENYNDIWRAEVVNASHFLSLATFYL